MNDKTNATDQDAIQRETKQAQDVIRQTEFHVRDVTLVILTLLAILYTLYFAADIILPFVFALVLALLLSPAMRFLCDRLRFPRMLAAVLLIAALFSGIGAVGYAVSVPARSWIAKAPQSLPVLQKKLSFLRRPIDMFEGGMQQIQHLMAQSGHGGPGEQSGEVQAAGDAGEAGGNAQGGAAPNPGQASSQSGAQAQSGSQAAPRATPPAPAASQGGGGAGIGMTLLSGTRSFLGEALTLIVTLFFLLADGDALLRRFVEILPGFQEKKRAVTIATEVERNISGYLATITLMNVLVGVANGLNVWAFGLPDPLLFGVAAFLLNYIPILGALTGMVMFFFVGLFTFSNVLWALGPVGVYLLIHIAEGETITPMLLARRFTLNPLLVIVSLMFWDWLWGVAGALLAVPLLAVVKILCDHVEQLTPLGHLLGAEPNRKKVSRK